MKNLTFVVAVLTAVLLAGCRSSVSTNPSQPSGGVQNVVVDVRQRLADLSEPTFSSLEVYTHDLSAKGVSMLVEKYPDSKVPLRLLANTGISLLEKQTVTMLDVVVLTQELDSIKDGKVKPYLDLAWTLLEINGVIRRADLTAQLTVREQRLLLALLNGIFLGTNPQEEVSRVLNSYGPRYSTDTK